MKITDIKATTVTVPLEAPLRHANGCHWGRFVRTIVEVETDEGLIGLGEMGGGGESAEAAITSERLELLAPSFIPQHSDARVLEHLLYKWEHSRQFIADALHDSYEQLRRSGRAVTREEIVRDVTRMFSGNFYEWIGRSLV